MNIPFINLQETCPHTMKETAMPQYMQISWWQSLSILYDNLGCLQWWKSWHHKKSLFSVSMVLYTVQQGEGWSTDWTLFSRQTPHNLTSGPSYRVSVVFWEKIYHVTYLSSYPGYFQEPHWFSMGLPEISRATWQVWCYNRTIQFYVFP